MTPGAAPDLAAADPAAAATPGIVTTALAADPGGWRDALLALSPGDDAAFDGLARAAFEHQTGWGGVYATFADGVPWRCWRAAPLLPIAAFCLAPVTAFNPSEAEAVFVSSGTTAQTGQSPARHHVRSLDLYRSLSAEGFRRALGAGPVVLACHLPGYAERGAASSLVSMADHLVATVGAEGSGFFLDDTAPFERALVASRATGTPLLLLGAAFGLLDLAETGRWRLPPGARVIETGGMKTRRRELPRSDLHAALADGFGLGVDRIGSEYGMAELTSQGWAVSGGRYAAPPWMRVRALDPAAFDRGEMRDAARGTPGRLAVVDLGNVYSAPFLATDDRAIVHADGTFEVLGRMPDTSLRGCNFLLDA